MLLKVGICKYRNLNLNYAEEKRIKKILAKDLHKKKAEVNYINYLF